MNSIIVPTGYMGSGSSAITDLISEFEGYYAPNNSYEYVFLHCPDGVFDLEDKLLIGNNAIRSDEAIRAFEMRMKALFNKKNYWVGSYNHFVSPDFMKYSEAFIDSIVTESFKDAYWYYQEEPDSAYMQIMLYLRRVINSATKGKIKLKKPLRYSEMREAFPTEEEFYSNARVFINKVLMDLGCNNCNLILDQLLLPHNLYRMGNYFADNLKVIVVDRDPRDVFLLNKYIWAKNHVSVPYPYEAASFCEYYRRMRDREVICRSSNVLRLHFEDLVYNYEQILADIYDFLEIDLSKHRAKKTMFIPEKSINNTQLFNIPDVKSEIKRETIVIEECLSNYLYDFPRREFEGTGFCNIF